MASEGAPQELHVHALTPHLHRPGLETGVPARPPLTAPLCPAGLLTRVPTSPRRGHAPDRVSGVHGPRLPAATSLRSAPGHAKPSRDSGLSIARPGSLASGTRAPAGGRAGRGPGRTARPAPGRAGSRAQKQSLLAAQTDRITFIFLPSSISHRPKSRSVSGPETCRQPLQGAGLGPHRSPRPTNTGRRPDGRSHPRPGPRPARPY